MEEGNTPRETSPALVFGAGLVGALAGAAVCAAISLRFHIVLGGLGVVVGLGAACGVWLATMKQGGPIARRIAFVCAVLGFLAATHVVKGYFHANWVEAKEGIRPALFDARVWKYVWGNPDGHFGGFDVLGIALALWGASSVPSAGRRATPPVP